VEGDTVLAFNWQNWPRTELLEVEISEGQHLVDLATGQPVPLDIIFTRDGYRRVRFLAESVPPMGYRGYAIRSLQPPAESESERLKGETIESAFYRLRVDPASGGIVSLFDKAAGRELVDAKAEYKLNQYLYVSGGEGSLILNHNFGTPPAELRIASATEVRIEEILKTPFGQRMTVVMKAPNTPELRSEYRVYDRIKRVDIVNTVDKEETRAKEAVYFAFPFAARQPGFECQIQNGWVRPNADQLPGACREWFTPQNLVHVRDGDFSVAWASPDAPLVTLTDINRGKWPTHLAIDNGHLYSYVMHNYWFTNYRARQGGRFVFRYSLTSGADLGREALSRFDADTRAPVFAYPFVSSFSARVGGKGRPFPAKSGSFLEVAGEHVQMVVLKQAEDGAGWILRFRETAGREGEAMVRLPHLKVEEAHLCNGVEVNQRRLELNGNEFTVPCKPNQYVTVRVQARWEGQPSAGEAER